MYNPNKDDWDTRLELKAGKGNALPEIQRLVDPQSVTPLPSMTKDSSNPSSSSPKATKEKGKDFEVKPGEVQEA